MKSTHYSRTWKLLGFILLIFISTSACGVTENPAPSQAPESIPSPPPTTDPSIYPNAGLEPSGPAVSEYGPWVFYQTDPQHRGGNFAYQLANGSEEKLLDDPAYMGDFELFLNGAFDRIILPSPAGDQVAFYVTKDHKAQVWVLDLVKNAITAKIDLFLTETDADPKTILSNYLWRHKMMQWSPDGNFLALAANLQSSEHSLLLYDFTAHEISTLAGHKQHIGLIDWSPDSHSVVYVTLPTLGPTVTNSFVWAATIEGQYLPIVDMSPAYMVQSLGWMDFGKVLIEDLQWEHPPTNKRILDVNSGRVTAVFYEFTTNAYLLPDWQLLFANIYEGSIYFPEAPTEMEQGIYIKQLGDGDLNLIIPSKTAHMVDWYPEIEKFLVFDGSSAFLYNLNGEIAWEPPQTRNIFPSPDGNYVLIGSDPLLEIYTPSGELLWSTPASGTDRLHWLPDSSGFYHFGDSDLGVFVSLYTENSTWEAEILDNVIWTGYEYQYFIVE